MLAAQSRRRRHRAQVSRQVEADRGIQGSLLHRCHTSLSFSICVTLACGYRSRPRCVNTVARDKLAQPITTSTHSPGLETCCFLITFLLPHHIPASSLLELHPESELGKVPVFQRKSQTKTDPKLFRVNRDSVSYIRYIMFSYSRFCIPYQDEEARVQE